MNVAAQILNQKRKIKGLEHDYANVKRELDITPPGQFFTHRGKSVGQAKTRKANLWNDLERARKELNRLEAELEKEKTLEGKEKTQ